MTIRNTPNLLRAIRRYAGKFQTLRDDIRTERFMNTLPADLRKDIGWPDQYAERRAARR